MSSSIRRNLIKNGIANSLKKFVNIGEQLALVPFLISSWGAPFYGEWITLTILPSVLSFTNVGIGSSAANLMVLRFANENVNGARSAAICGIKMITYTIFIALILSVVCIFILDKMHLFEKSLIPREDSILTLAILMSSRYIFFYQPIYDAYFRCSRKASMSINLLSVYSLSNLLTSFIVLYNHGGVVALSITNLCITSIFLISYSIIAENMIQGLFERGSLVETYKSDIKTIITNGLGYLGSPLWQTIYFQGSTLVVRVVLGPTTVALYNTLRAMTRSANQLFGLIHDTVFSELQFEIGAGRLDKARKLFRICLGLTVFISIIGMIILAIFGPQLYNLWTQNLFNPPKTLWIIFIMGIGFNALWYTAGVVFFALNKTVNFAIICVTSSIFSVLFAYLLSVRFGILGAAIGAFSFDVILAVYVIPVCCRYIYQSIYTLPIDIIRDMKTYLYNLLNKLYLSSK
ncbi:lipopolysaccharide biosynthesis protein [Salmonirosea aquatica]|uniref:Oligosaccharide flippase family protein n=1 Tax=Salmonirosea aquatica TaxID=2654236 RepID=A0A7C9BD95_9BACT|nr:hypothetical protein [Cytophagaceae bacterium SJW1-29]